jgi:transcriptional regulator with GAF, ATPase, and Fis domain
MFSCVDELPEEAQRDKAFFRRSGRKSLISLPLKIGGRVAGVMVLASLQAEIPWPDWVVRRLRLLADVLAGVLERKQSRLEVEDRLRFEMLLAETSARLINLSHDQLDREILDMMRCVCESLDIERSTLWLLAGKEAGTVQLEYFYDRGGRSAPKRLHGKQLFPWVLDKVMAGEIVTISKLSDLPEEAARDKETFSFYGTKSSLIIPLSTGGLVFGVVSFAFLRQEVEWPKSVVNRLKLVAQMFANALARQHAERAMRESAMQLNERLQEIEKLKKRYEDENVYLQEEVKQLSKQPYIVGQSVAIRTVLLQAKQVARTGTTVLIQGETGTGKELLAHAIHNMSERKDRLLVTVNCAALPPALIESELFGREKGAYTGALTRMSGRFEVAHGSTLFLDEIGELPPELQGKLLRVIEDGCFERLGSTKSIHVDVRLIAASNRDLTREVEDGRFRKDLFYRLSVFPIVIPPLRERPEDIPLLVWAFVTEFREKMGKRIDNIPKKTMDLLKSYAWPGNARELRNVIEHAMIVSKGRTLEMVLPKAANGIASKQNLHDVERSHILNVLERTSWRVTGKSGAAEILGLKGTTLQSKMKKLGIERPAALS